jgi:hypothetical protein
MGLLLSDELVEGEGELLFEGVFIGLFGLILASFGGFEEGVVAAAEACFEITPDPVDGSGGSAGVVDIVLASAVEFVFEFCAEVSALERFGEEEALEGVVLEVFADVREAFLAVLEGADEGVEDAFGFVLFSGVSWHRVWSTFRDLDRRAGSTG